MGGVHMNNILIALNTTFVGIFIVFLALVLLSLIIFAVSKILHKKDNTDAKPENLNEGAILNSENTEFRESDAPTGNVPDDELVAVLTAAVMACMKGQHVYNFRIKSFRRVPQSTPIWNRAGRMEYISNKL